MEENGNLKTINEGLRGTIRVCRTKTVLSAANTNLQAAVTQGQDVINSLSGELVGRSLPLDSRSQASFKDISRANSIGSHGNKRKSKSISFSTKAWNGGKDEEITVLLARMELCFQAHNGPKAVWSTSILQSWSDKPFQLWNLELQAFKDSYAPHDWNVFCAYMKKSSTRQSAEHVTSLRYLDRLGMLDRLPMNCVD